MCVATDGAHDPTGSPPRLSVYEPAYKPSSKFSVLAGDGRTWKRIGPTQRADLLAADRPSLDRGARLRFEVGDLRRSQVGVATPWREEEVDRHLPEVHVAHVVGHLERCAGDGAQLVD